MDKITITSKSTGVQEHHALSHLEKHGAEAMMGITYSLHILMDDAVDFSSTFGHPFY